MDEKFAPGEWEAQPSGDNDGLWTVRDASGQIVFFGMSESRARMIAAAPDLYEALANLSPRFERCCIASGSDPEYAREATAKSRSALSKARGDTR